MEFSLIFNNCIPLCSDVLTVEKLRTADKQQEGPPHPQPTRARITQKLPCEHPGRVLRVSFSVIAYKVPVAQGFLLGLLHFLPHFMMKNILITLGTKYRIP